MILLFYSISYLFFDLEFNPPSVGIYRTLFHFPKRMHVDVDVAAGPSAEVLLKYEGSGGGRYGERRRFSLIRTWPRAFEGISDVKAWGRRLPITSPAQPASLHRHDDIDQRHSWERQGRTDSGEETKKKRRGHLPKKETSLITAISTWSIN